MNKEARNDQIFIVTVILLVVLYDLIWYRR